MIATPSSSPDLAIGSAVEFLQEVHKKGYEESDLRRYLINKKGLTNVQVNTAFKVVRDRLAGRSSAEDKGSSLLEASCNSAAGADSEPVRSEQKEDYDRQGKSKAENSEGVSMKNSSPKHPFLSYLKSEKQVEGDMLLKDFLKTELDYCKLLECLLNDYYPKLSQHSSQGKINMTRNEVELLFQYVPTLLSFHRSFYVDLNRGSNIGRHFVRLFQFFRGYIDYMKSCNSVVDKIRQYTSDRRLFKLLEEVREASICKSYDMTDLMLVPLDRINDYKKFLSQLLEFAKKEETTDYEFLGKAVRRIGRVADYIEKYKDGISNRNEMNKIQQFLTDEVDILNPNRTIIRHGIIIRRTTGWTARNKNYIFFLFNDILLWTSKKGVFQNAIPLFKCDLMESDAKNNPERKFKIKYTGEKPKTLLLECTTKLKRDEWYQSVDAAISDAKAINVHLKSVYSPEKVQENHNGELAIGIKCKEAVQNENVSVEYREVERNNRSRQSFVDEDEDKGIKTHATQTPSRTTFENKSVMSDEESSIQNETKIDENFFDVRYRKSRGYKNSEFSDFEVFDDNVSQVSEYDHQFYEQHDEYSDIKNVSRTERLSPFQMNLQSCKTSSGRVIIPRNDQNLSEWMSPLRSKDNLLIDQRDCGAGLAGVEGSNASTATLEPDTNIVRRTRSPNRKPSTPVENARLAKKSSFTVRLKDFS